MEVFYKNWLKLQNLSDSGIADDQFEPTNIIFENNQFKLVLEKGYHKRQKIFRLEDHLFYLKLIPKTSSDPPLLSDILDFLHAGFIHILDEIKHFYKAGKKIHFAYLFCYSDQKSNQHQGDKVGRNNCGSTLLFIWSQNI